MTGKKVIEVLKREANCGFLLEDAKIAFEAAAQFLEALHYDTPVRPHRGFGGHLYCQTCGKIIDKNEATPGYCPHCGRELKRGAWE